MCGITVGSPISDDLICCSECRREADEFTAIKERWEFWSDGHDLLPYSPACSEREFGGEATEPVPLVHPRAGSNGFWEGLENVPGEPLNIFDPAWEEIREEPPGFRAKRLYLARTLGAEQLGVSLWEIDPGQSNMPSTPTTRTRSC